MMPKLVYCRDRLQEASEICARVLDELELGTWLKEQAVLMRAGRNADALELELARRRIPFVKYGGIRYLEAAHIKDFICLLRIATHPEDQLSWFRVLKLLEGVGPVTARRAHRRARARTSRGFLPAPDRLLGALATSETLSCLADNSLEWRRIRSVPSSTFAMA